jgi:hypothetical protein
MRRRGTLVPGGALSPEAFLQRVGRRPEQDDLDRTNCPTPGEIGHWYCGWCSVCARPMFECRCDP